MKEENALVAWIASEGGEVGRRRNKDKLLQLVLLLRKTGRGGGRKKGQA